MAVGSIIQGHLPAHRIVRKEIVIFTIRFIIIPIIRSIVLSQALSDTGSINSRRGDISGSGYNLI